MLCDLLLLLPWSCSKVGWVSKRAVLGEAENDDHDDHDHIPWWPWCPWPWPWCPWWPRLGGWASELFLARQKMITWSFTNTPPWSSICRFVYYLYMICLLFVYYSWGFTNTRPWSSIRRFLCSICVQLAKPCNGCLDSSNFKSFLEFQSKKHLSFFSDKCARTVQAQSGRTIERGPSCWPLWCTSNNDDDEEEDGDGADNDNHADDDVYDGEDEDNDDEDIT